MYTYVANLNRVGSLQGRGGTLYYVATATIIKPGILNGSKGKLLYPMEHIEASTDKWEGVPISLEHPVENNEFFPVRYEETFKYNSLGFLTKPKIVNHSLRAEAWFDLEKVKNVSSVLHDKLIQGHPIEVSTGLIGKLYSVPKGSVYNGEEYIGIVGDYVPDHLAVLLSGPGACSLKDGCGIHNSCKCQKCEEAMTKAELIQFITTNSSVWNREDSKESLDKFDVPSLELIKAQEDVIKGLKVTNSALDKTVKNQSETIDILNKKVETSPTPEKKNMTKDEWMAQAPPEVVGLLNYATQKQNEEKSRLVDLLVVNVSDPAEKDKKIKALMLKDIEDLKEIASLLGSTIANNAPRPVFAPQYIPPVAVIDNRNSIEESDLLIPEEVDWSK